MRSVLHQVMSSNEHQPPDLSARLAARQRLPISPGCSHCSRGSARSSYTWQDGPTIVGNATTSSLPVDPEVLVLQMQSYILGRTCASCQMDDNGYLSPLKTSRQAAILRAQSAITLWHAPSDPFRLRGYQVLRRILRSIRFQTMLCRVHC